MLRLAWNGMAHFVLAAVLLSRRQEQQLLLQQQQSLQESDATSVSVLDLFPVMDSSLTRRVDQQSSLVFLLLYHNLGGEMIYILNQRLSAQNVQREKAHQVLIDVIANFVNSRNYWLRTFLCCSGRRLDSLALKIPFESIISSSPIMKLTPTSYDKLYDLMVGVFKYQVCQSNFPSSLFHVTLNHINSILDLASEIGQGIRNVVKAMQQSFVEKFSQLSKNQWNSLRNVILSNFMIDIRTRISILIREKEQIQETGAFIITVPSAPENMFNGRITHYNDEGKVIEEIGVYCESVNEMTALGTDIYSSEGDERPAATSSTSSSTSASEKDKLFQVNGEREASLLANLLGARSRPQQLTSGFALEFKFKDDDRESSDEEDQRVSSASKVSYERINDKTPSVQNVTCKLVRASTFDLDHNKRKEEDEEEDDCEPSEGDELLALMDS